MYYINSENVAEIFRRYANMVYRVILCIVKNPQDAEDLVMDCFTAAIDKQGFSDENHLKGWLITTAQHKAINLVKSARVRRNVPLEEAAQTGASDSVHYSELLDMVLRLPNELKTVIYMYYYEELTVQEIAGLLKISENTVYKRLAKGRSKLKMSLEE